MIYRFASFELDTAKFELRHGGSVIPVEPQVLSLLFLLVENQDRVVTKDEIVEKIWNSRAISDSALSSRIKTARQVLQDDGKQQKFIRTLHGLGFRFIHPVIQDAATAAIGSRVAERGSDSSEAGQPATSGRPSVAVLPFRLVGIAGNYGHIAEALPHELIAALSRLRWLLVIARASSFRFRSATPDLEQVGKTLNVGYCLTGSVEIAGRKLLATVELADTKTASVVWSERYTGDLDAIHEIRERVVNSVVSELDVQIPANEAQRAKVAGSASLDAWGAYHLALNHMFRFTKQDNLAAQSLFERALQIDPEFARAHAGVSFTRFQNAFLRYTPEVDAEMKAARQSAERAIGCDGLDPFANLVMGRSHWIEGDLPGSLAWLGRATQLNPNYAQGVYLQAMTKTLSGQGSAGERDVSSALELSPLDPLRYAMIGTRALALIVQDDASGAVSWAEQAAHTPGAHVHLDLIAAISNAMTGNNEQAERWAARAQQRRPGISSSDFLRAFPFDDANTRRQITTVLARLGF